MSHIGTYVSCPGATVTTLHHGSTRKGAPFPRVSSVEHDGSRAMPTACLLLGARSNMRVGEDAGTGPSAAADRGHRVVRDRPPGYPPMLSTRVCTTERLSTVSCGPFCARTCGGKFFRETPCGGCANPRIPSPTSSRTEQAPGQPGAGTGGGTARPRSEFHPGGGNPTGCGCRRRGASGQVVRPSAAARSGLPDSAQAAAVTPAGRAGSRVSREQADGQLEAPRTHTPRGLVALQHNGFRRTPTPRQNRSDRFGQLRTRAFTGR